LNDPGPQPPISLADDLLEGASAIAEFYFGDPRKRRKVYHLVEKGALPVFHLGEKICARKSSLMSRIESEEARAMDSGSEEN
jgi:hypothetical protein